MWELNYKQSWAPKHWCFWIVVLEKTVESPMDCMEIKPVNPKQNQPWMFIGRTDAEAEAPILWLPDLKSRLIGKDPDTEKDWGQEEKREKRMRWLDGIREAMDMSLSKLWEMDREGQGSLACCSPWSHKESDTTEQLSLILSLQARDSFLLVLFNH